MCSRCSSNKAPIKYLKYERVRVCNSCFERLKISMFFFVCFFKYYSHFTNVVLRIPK